MRTAHYRKIGLLLFLFFALIFVSGCETVTALNQGDVRMQDLVKMAKIDTPQRKGLNSSGYQGSTPFDNVQTVDSWFKSNLW